MIAIEAEIVAAALGLPPETRAILADQLLDSLHTAENQAEIDAAWRKEIEARIDAYDRGETKTYPAEEVLRELGLRDE